MLPTLDLPFTDDNRLLRISSPLDGTPFILAALEGEESVSSPFFFRLSLRSPEAGLELKRLVGHQVNVSIQSACPEPRYIHGRLSEFASRGSDGEMTCYEAHLVPWLHFLRLGSDCRIFQGKSVPDIITEVFGRYGNLADYRMKLDREHPVIDLATQYNESDFDFVSRLLGAEGIHYYFEFAKDRHVMVLADESCFSHPLPQCPRISYGPAPGPREEDHISTWEACRDAAPSTYAARSFDYKEPWSPAEATGQAIWKADGLPDLEIFEHEGAYAIPGRQAGPEIGRLRAEEMNLLSKHFHGSSDVRTLCPGYAFELAGHPEAGCGEEATFFILSVRHEATNNLGRGLLQHYGNTFTCIRRKVPFRPGRSTIIPVVPGPQTAIVVGPQGEEIHTDALGRVKIQFHWDRKGRGDGSTSCWVRVATPWAGQGFGFIALPRVGTEVLVAFLEGNPDRPVVAGMVFNANCSHPWPLPQDRTQSGILTASTPGRASDACNALRFEDRKGEEEIWLHAEKDQRLEVENDESHSVGRDRKLQVGHDQRTEIGADHTETVGGDAVRTVHGHERSSVLLTRNANVLLTDTLQVGAARTVTVGGAHALSVGAFMNTLVTGAQATEVMMDRSLRVFGNQRTTIGKDHGLAVAGNSTQSFGQALGMTATASMDLVCGSAAIRLLKDGKVLIVGSAVDISAEGDVTVNGKKLHLN